MASYRWIFQVEAEDEELAYRKKPENSLITSRFNAHIAYQGKEEEKKLNIRALKLKIRVTRSYQRVMLEIFTTFVSTKFH